MIYNDNRYNNGKSISNVFADYFKSVYTDYVTILTAVVAVANPSMLGVSHFTMGSIEEKDLYWNIQKLKTKSTVGPDMIPQYIFKGSANIFLDLLPTFLTWPWKLPPFLKNGNSQKSRPYLRHSNHLINNYRHLFQFYQCLQKYLRKSYTDLLVYTYISVSTWIHAK